MGVLTLEQIKTHLRLELNDNSQDEYLRELEAQAIDYASQYLGRPVPWSTDEESEFVPASVKRALLLLIADYDQHRENIVVGGSVGNTGVAERLMHFYRVGLGI